VPGAADLTCPSYHQAYTFQFMASAPDVHLFYNPDGTIRGERRKHCIGISDDDNEPVSRNCDQNRSPDISASRVDVYVDSEVGC
jgi:hypothetical protein